MRETELGWTRLGDSFSLAGADQEEAERNFSHLFTFFRNGARIVQGATRPGRYSLLSPYYVSEIEDLLRAGLMLFDTTAVEVPVSPESPFDAGTYVENGVACEASFLSGQALASVSESISDAVEGRELVILPSFHVTWDEESYPFPTQYDIAELLAPVSEAHSLLSRAELLSLSDFDSDEGEGAAQFPTLSGGDIRELVRLRRDERDHFLKWLEELDKIRGAESPDPGEAVAAVRDGLGDLSDRLRLLKRKGLLEATGAALGTTSIGVAAITGGADAVVSGAFALGATAVSMLRAVLDSRQESEQAHMNPLYFLWLTRRLRKW